MTSSPILLWFRNDLRLNDNPALKNACELSLKKNSEVICVYINETTKHFSSNYGSAAKWWLHQSLAELDKDLCEISKNKLSQSINFFDGNAEKIISSLCKTYKIKNVFFNRRYELENIIIEKNLYEQLKDNDVIIKTSNGSTLIEPWLVKGKQGQALKVFTPYKNSLIRNHEIPKPLDKPKSIRLLKVKESIKLDDLHLFKSNWMKKFSCHWKVGEKSGIKKINFFLSENINKYELSRNIMGIEGTSKLSPHFNFGEVSPRYVWHKIVDNDYESLSQSKKVFLSEIVWREFAKNLLILYPSLYFKNIKEYFNNFKWEENKANFDKWKKGKTGYPIVDAAMKELWDYGWMHNRSRMIVASFLTKHLLIPWQWGADWFHDTLLDGDLASNYASWQWVSGCGADAAPYFRIFNPTTQSIKFDPCGNYIKKHLPVLSILSKEEIHNPQSSKNNLNYPEQIVDHKFARERALRRYSTLKRDK